MKKANIDIRDAIRNARLAQWQVADRIGVAESTLVRWLRIELTDERKQQLLAAIKELSSS